jgi:hypothetical protein
MTVPRGTARIQVAQGAHERQSALPFTERYFVSGLNSPQVSIEEP